ncbi:MAG TPA: hypothetical protein VHN77_10615 [Phycisphaerales bacterium]|nr:hypothetical protein [Phycisphaerales bacterium]
MPRRCAVTVLLSLTIGSYCANAQTPAYTVQIVPDPPVSGLVSQHVTNQVLPNGRFAVLSRLESGNAVQYVGNEAGWTVVQPMDGFAYAVVDEVTDDGTLFGRSVTSLGDARATFWPQGNVQAPQWALSGNFVPVSVNQQGVFAGYRAGPGPSDYAPATWQNGTVTTLPTSAGYSQALVKRVNASGQSVGIAFPDSGGPPIRALRWSAGAVEVLPLPSGEVWDAQVSDLNDDGWSVGNLWMPGTFDGTVLWRNGGVELIGPGFGVHEAMISNTGDVLLGAYDDINATTMERLWRDGLLYESGELLTPGFGGQLHWMQKLLDDGRLIGVATVNGVDRNVLLTPIPAPATLSLMVFVALVSHRRRRSAPRVHHP